MPKYLNKAKLRALRTKFAKYDALHYTKDLTNILIPSSETRENENDFEKLQNVLKSE